MSSAFKYLRETLILERTESAIKKEIKERNRSIKNAEKLLKQAQEVLKRTTDKNSRTYKDAESAITKWQGVIDNHSEKVKKLTELLKSYGDQHPDGGDDDTSDSGSTEDTEEKDYSKMSDDELKSEYEKASEALKSIKDPDEKIKASEKLDPLLDELDKRDAAKKRTDAEAEQAKTSVDNLTPQSKGGDNPNRPTTNPNNPGLPNPPKAMTDGSSKEIDDEVEKKAIQFDTVDDYIKHKIDKAKKSSTPNKLSDAVEKVENIDHEIKGQQELIKDLDAKIKDYPKFKAKKDLMIANMKKLKEYIGQNKTKLQDETDPTVKAKLERNIKTQQDKFDEIRKNVIELNITDINELKNDKKEAQNQLRQLSSERKGYARAVAKETKSFEDEYYDAHGDRQKAKDEFAEAHKKYLEAKESGDTEAEKHWAKIANDAEDRMRGQEVSEPPEDTEDEEDYDSEGSDAKDIELFDKARKSAEKESKLDKKGIIGQTREAGNRLATNILDRLGRGITIDGDKINDLIKDSKATKYALEKVDQMNDKKREIFLNSIRKPYEKRIEFIENEIESLRNQIEKLSPKAGDSIVKKQIADLEKRLKNYEDQLEEAEDIYKDILEKSKNESVKYLSKSLVESNKSFNFVNYLKNKIGE